MISHSCTSFSCHMHQLWELLLNFKNKLSPSIFMLLVNVVLILSDEVKMMMPLEVHSCIRSDSIILRHHSVSIGTLTAKGNVLLPEEHVYESLIAKGTLIARVTLTAKGSLIAKAYSPVRELGRISS